MKKLLALSLVLLLNSCSWFNSAGCDIEKAAAGAITTGISTIAVCSNPGQILSDVSAILAKTGVCSTASVKSKGLLGGPIASALCPELTIVATAEFGSKVLPASWGCNPSAGTVPQVLNQACQLLPF
jgi:hypothetical protein